MIKVNTTEAAYRANYSLWSETSTLKKRESIQNMLELTLLHCGQVKNPFSAWIWTCSFKARTWSKTALQIGHSKIFFSV